MANAK